METLQTITDAKEAQLIQKKLYDAGIPCYIREIGDQFRVEVSQSDLAKAKTLLSSVVPVIEPSFNTPKTEPLLSEEKPTEKAESEKARDILSNKTGEDVSPSPQLLCCLRCQMELDYVGPVSLQTWILLGAWEGGRNVVIYNCPSCGHLEFFSPQSPWALAPQTGIQPLLEEAEVLNGRGQVTKAIAVYEEIIKKYPNSSWSAEAETAISALRNRLQQRVVQTTKSEAEARIIQQLLNKSGIDCYVIALSAGGYEIRVAETDIQTVKTLLKESQAQELRAENSDTLCPHCHVPLRYLEERQVPMGLQVGAWNTHLAQVGMYLCPQCYQFLFLNNLDQMVNVALTSEERYDRLSEIAAELIDEKKLSQAVEVYTQIVAEFPGYAKDAMRSIRILNERIAKEK